MSVNGSGNIRFAAEVESKIPKLERRQTLMQQAKDIWERVGCASDNTDL
ncbi:MAG TPA: hypothetical protein VKA40_11405 [Nitrososphaera sp.]|nr:hypothetical protein [Nitrososphaera sp.]